MSDEFDPLHTEAERLKDRGRLTLAIRALQRAHAAAAGPQRGFGSYRLGAVYYHDLGDGVSARREFAAAAREFVAHGYGRFPAFRLVHADALENGMLCALSFDEFELLAATLREITPNMPILAGLVPIVRAARERGEPWSAQLFMFAFWCYDRNDPSRDAGRYGQAKSTYHLLLAHRRELHLAREDWSLAAYEYCALSMRMAADCMRLRGLDEDVHSPEEFLPILTDACPLLDEYLEIHSGNRMLAKSRAGMDTMIRNARGRWNVLTRQAPQLFRFRCRQCHAPVSDPLLPCPACGMPSEIAVSTVTAGVVAMLLCGAFVYRLVAPLPLWVRAAACVITSLIAFAWSMGAALRIAKWWHRNEVDS